MLDELDLICLPDPQLAVSQIHDALESYKIDLTELETEEKDCHNDQAKITLPKLSTKKSHAILEISSINSE